MWVLDMCTCVPYKAGYNMGSVAIEVRVQVEMHGRPSQSLLKYFNHISIRLLDRASNSSLLAVRGPPCPSNSGRCVQRMLFEAKGKVHIHFNLHAMRWGHWGNVPKSHFVVPNHQDPASFSCIVAFFQYLITKAKLGTSDHT